MFSVALWTLGQIVENTGYVIEPYQKYPGLLDILMKFLKTEQSKGIRREAIRVLGILGALDPYKRNVYLGAVDTAANSTGLALSMPEPKNIGNDRRMGEWYIRGESCVEEYFRSKLSWIVQLWFICFELSAIGFACEHFSLVAREVTQTFYNILILLFNLTAHK